MEGRELAAGAAPVASRGEAEGPLLLVQNVSYSFGSVKAVREATFSVARNAITGMIGPNGAGKSSMVGIICGALKPESGKVTFDQEDVTDLAPFVRARRGLIRMFQMSSEFGRLTVLENLLVAGRNHPGERLIASLLRGRRGWVKHETALIEAAWEILRRFGLESKANDYAETLSGGQKRILELMRALMADPKLLVLDEPLAGVSPALSDEIAQRLIELRDGGLTMLLIEHELELVERMCDHVVAMGDGKVIAEGTMRALRASRAVQDAYSSG